MIEWILSSSALIVFVVLLRLLLKSRIGLSLQYALWGLVLIRLLIPISFGETRVSVANTVPVIQEKVDGWQSSIEAAVEQSLSVSVSPGDTPASAEDTRLPADNTVISSEDKQAPGEDVQKTEETSISTTVQGVIGNILSRDFDVAGIVRMVWYVGMGLVGAWLILGNLWFFMRLRRSRQKTDLVFRGLAVYVSEAVETPCLLGLFRPAIYLTPESLTDERMQYHAVEHEWTHYRHGDGYWSLLRGVALVLHWYNPLVWTAATLSQRDAELCCDECTVRRIGEESRKGYGETLIRLTCQKRSPSALIRTATTMTGSAKSLKERLALLMKRPRTAKYTFVPIILVLAIVMGCTMTGGMAAEVPDALNEMDHTNISDTTTVTDTTDFVSAATTTVTNNTTTTESLSGTTVDQTTVTGAAEPPALNDPVLFFSPLSMDEYSDVPQISAMSNVTMKFKSFRFPMCVSIPTAWNAQVEDLNANLNYAVLYRDGKRVGRIVPWKFVDKSCSSTVTSAASTTLTMPVEMVQYTDAGRSAYSYRTYVALADCPTVCLEIDASEVSLGDFVLMAQSVFFTDVLQIYSSLGITNNSHLSVAIYGDETVSTSSLGSTLESMCEENGRSVSLVVESHAGYTAADYAADSKVAEAMKHGCYDVVFLCGFESGEDSDCIPILESYCEISGTTLVLLPTPNESREMVELAYDNCQSAYIADWQQLTEHLIDQQISEQFLTTFFLHSSSSICYKIDYGHVNGQVHPACGYAAAAMMYYMMYETAPATGTGIADARNDLCDNFYLSPTNAELLLENIRQLAVSFVE